MPVRPLILLHGWLGEPADWDPVRARLGRGFDGHALALPGHAGAPPPTEETLAAVLSQLLARWPTPDQPALVVGYSMGGRLALHLALRHPQLVSGLVLVSASPGIEAPAERARRRALDAARARQLETGSFNDFLAAWYDQPLFASLRRRPALRRALLARRAAPWQRRAPARLRPSAPAALAAMLRALCPGRIPALWARLPRLRMPVAWVAGALDAPYVAALTRAADLCPRGRRIIVPGVGHLPHLEQPGRVVAIIRALAREVP